MSDHSAGWGGRNRQVAENILDRVAGTIVAMAHRLGQSEIAEPAETREQLRDLCATGCDAARGQLLGRPLAPEKIAALRACTIPTDTPGGRRAE